MWVGESECYFVWQGQAGTRSTAKSTKDVNKEEAAAQVIQFRWVSTLPSRATSPENILWGLDLQPSRYLRALKQAVRDLNFVDTPFLYNTALFGADLG